MAKQPVNAGGGRMPPANRGGTPPYNSNNVDLLIDYGDWAGVENYVSTYLRSPWDPARVHPMLFLHIRRAWILDLISQGRVEHAASVFGGVRPIFEAILAAGPGPGQRYCVPGDLANEMAFIQRCLDDRKCYDHKYNNEMMKPLVTDYMMLHVPHKLGIAVEDLRRSDPRWKFAIPLRHAPVPAFRCLVCSIASFESTDIGMIMKHLKDECTGPKTQFVIENVESLNVDGETRKRARTSGAETDPTESLATILDKIRGEVNKVEAIAVDVAEKSSQTCDALKNVKKLLTAAEAAARESAAPGQATNAQTHSPPAGAPPPGVVSTSHPVNHTDDSDWDWMDPLDEQLKQAPAGDGRSLYDLYFW